MSLGSKKYRLLQNDLDQVGVTTLIKRITKGWFELYVNFEIVKGYKTRGSCNRQIVKLHKAHCDGKKAIAAG